MRRPLALSATELRKNGRRLGLRQLVDRHRRQRIGSCIVEGYRQRPQTEAEVGWADGATARMIAEEPW